MPSLPTLPQRSALERVSLGLAFALIALGGLTLAGWWPSQDGRLVAYALSRWLGRPLLLLAVLAIGVALAGGIAVRSARRPLV